MPRLMEACTAFGANPAAFLFVSLMMVIVVAACSGSESIATSGVPAAKATPSEPPNLNGIVAGSEILVGDQRLPFGLFDFDGNPVEGADVEVEIYKLHQNGSLIPVSSADATFQEVHGIKRNHQHADGSNHDHQEVRGVYIVESPPFAEAGIWEAHLSVSGSNVSGTERATLTFQVKDQSTTFAVERNHNLGSDSARLIRTDGCRSIGGLQALCRYLLHTSILRDGNVRAGT